MKVMPIKVSPLAAALAGAAPDLVYWLMFLCSLEVGEALVLAHQLHDRREHRVGGARGVRVGDLHLVLEAGSSRSAQHFGSMPFFFASSSVL
jgi:hypothetical protein